MPDEAKTLLEHLLTAHLIVRSRTIKTAMLSRERDKYADGEIPEGETPNDIYYLNLAIDEMKHLRKHVIARIGDLSSDQRAEDV